MSIVCLRGDVSSPRHSMRAIRRRQLDQLRRLGLVATAGVDPVLVVAARLMRPATTATGRRALLFASPMPRVTGRRRDHSGSRTVRYCALAHGGRSARYIPPAPTARPMTSPMPSEPRTGHSCITRARSGPPAGDRDAARDDLRGPERVLNRRRSSSSPRRSSAMSSRSRSWSRRSRRRDCAWRARRLRRPAGAVRDRGGADRLHRLVPESPARRVGEASRRDEGARAHGRADAPRCRRCSASASCRRSPRSSLFRGVLARSLAAGSTRSIAIVVSSALFGVYHLLLAQMLPTFVLGLCARLR